MDEDDAFGPALPPELMASRNKVVPEEKRSESKAKRVLGPSMPGHERQSDDEEEESDDDYGPMPIPADARGTDTVSEGVREFLEKEEKRRKEVEVFSLFILSCSIAIDSSNLGSRKAEATKARRVDASAPFFI